MSVMSIEGSVAIEVGGEQLILLPQKAAFWPRERMSGNICRCGAYPNIVKAIHSVVLRQA